MDRKNFLFYNCSLSSVSVYNIIFIMLFLSEHLHPVRQQFGTALCICSCRVHS